MLNKFKIEFPAIACNESFARMVAAGFLLDLDPTFEELSEIKTAVSEAVTNAIIHGYGETDGNVIFEGCTDGKNISFTITDNGKGIADIELARTPLYTGLKNSERSGMGFTIMEEFMDGVDIHSVVGEGTKIVLSKKLSGGMSPDEL